MMAMPMGSGSVQLTQTLLKDGTTNYAGGVGQVTASGGIIKFFTISGGFHVYDKDEKYFAHVKGKMFGFKYKFLTEDGKVELGEVSKKLGGLAGLAKELFFSSDNYFLKVNPELAEQPLAKMLLLAATLAVDVIYKSESRGVGSDLLGE